MPLHIIETDYEPDDAMEMVSLASFSIDVDLIVIVGESRPHNKIKLVTDFFTAITNKYPNAYKSVKIIQGFGSDKDFPVDHQFEILEDSDETIIKNYIDAYSRNPEFSFMMKPPREAMITNIKCPNTVVYCYGSFNWRTLKMDKTYFRDFMARYKTFYYFDSFTAVGSSNSGIFNFNPSPINNIIKDLIVRWNIHIVNDLRKDLLTETNLLNIERKKKVISNVEASPNQFVLADVCLSMCPLPTKRSFLIEVNPYTKWADSEVSNIYVFDENTEERRELLLNNINKLFSS
jgi:hypothetical protein